MEPADPSPPDAATSSVSTTGIGPGDLIAGKYRIEKLLGEGGMGRVFLARHTMTKKLVALKFLREELASINDSAGRFMNEARAAVQMESEHVARVIDVDVLPSGVPYMVLEYLEGEDLASVVRRTTKLPPHVAVDYVLEACVAVAEAHAMGIIHRDLKPANLFLTHRKDGSAIVKVLDFGLAKVLEPLEGDPEYAATRVGDILGSPPFMSPEQLTGAESLDERTDIWSLGIVLYKLITGSVPFRGKPSSVRVIQIIQLPHEPLVRVVPDISPELSLAVDRCLAKLPDERFPSVAALAEALAPAGTAVGRAAADKARRILASSSRPSLTRPPHFDTPAPAPAAPPVRPTAPSLADPTPAPEPAPPPPAHEPLPSFHAVREPPSQVSASIDVVVDPASSEDAPTATLWSSSSHSLGASPDFRRPSGSRAPLIALAAGAVGLVALAGVVSALREAPAEPNSTSVSAQASTAAASTPLPDDEAPALPSAGPASPPAPVSADTAKKRSPPPPPAPPPAVPPRVGPSSTAGITREPPAWPKKRAWGGQH